MTGIDPKMQSQNLWFLGILTPVQLVELMNFSHLIFDGLLEWSPSLIEMTELLSELRRYGFGDLKHQLLCVILNLKDFWFKLDLARFRHLDTANWTRQ